MKVLDRGYWVSQHFYWQSMVHYLSNCVRFRSMTYFSACNPAIHLGGMLHDRKTDIYALLPQEIVPQTKVIRSQSEAIAFMSAQNLSFPVIMKPNVGLKGYKVYKINNDEEFNDFFIKNNVTDREWLLQEFLSQEKEFSVLFYRYPAKNEFGISSFVEKKYPFVIGDGEHSLNTLIDAYENPFLLRDEVKNRLSDQLSSIPSKGEKIILDFIGNYSRGAKFYSNMNHVSDEMCSMLDLIFSNVEGLNFFRIDFKSDSVKDFLEGNFKVLEINGMKSEPLHIYDTESSFLSNWKIIFNHWQIISRITKQQKDAYGKLPSFGEGLASWRSIKKLVK